MWGLHVTCKCDVTFAGDDMDPNSDRDSFFAKVENVRFLYRYPTTTNSATIGTLYLTATHLIFVDPSLKRETWILHSLIASVEKLPITAIGSPLLMRCKHFLCITFVIPREKEAHDIYQSLIQLSQPSNYSLGSASVLTVLLPSSY